MAVSETEFKRCCLAIIRSVEMTGKPVAITRRGKIVARLMPASTARHTAGKKPWEQLRGRATWLAEPEETFVSKPWERMRALGGRLLAKPGEAVLRDKDFKAQR